MPSLITSYFVKQDASNTTSLVTPSFTPSVGEIIVVKGVTADQSTTLSTPTDSQGNTYALRKSNVVFQTCSAYIWTTTTTAATAMTVTVAIGGTGNWHSMIVERWSNAALAATPATNGTLTGSASGPSSTITTTGANSVVSWCDGDWTATATTSRAYRTTSATPTEEALTGGDATNYTAYYAYQTATSAGSQTIGMTAPNQTWTIVGIEILDAGGPSASGGSIWIPPRRFPTIFGFGLPRFRLPEFRSGPIEEPPPTTEPYIGWGWGVNV